MSKLKSRFGLSQHQKRISYKFLGLKLKHLLQWVLLKKSIGCSKRVGRHWNLNAIRQSRTIWWAKGPHGECYVSG